MLSSNFGNGKLPLDVLGIVFRYFLEEESISSPLETVLLVCRAWNSAATSHKSLWSIFRCEIDDKGDCNLWRKCIPRRLAISGPESLIDIDIRGGSYEEDIDIRGGDHVDEIITALAGESGKNIPRWRRFCLHWDTLYGNDLLAHYLHSDTPCLQYLELHDFRDKEGILPYAPVLKTFVVSMFGCPYPNLNSATEVTIHEDFTKGTNRLEGPLTAENAISLNIEDCGSAFRLGKEFPALRHLSLQGRPCKELLSGFSAPHLQTLALSFESAHHFDIIKTAREIVFSQLRELQLGWWYEAGKHGIKEIIPSVYRIIEAASNVQILWLWNPGMARLVLKLLEDVDSFTDRHVMIAHKGSMTRLEHGERRLPSLLSFRILATLPQDCSWDEMLESFDGDAVDMTFFDNHWREFGLSRVMTSSSA